MSPMENHITICICTYRRPELLRGLLEKIAKQKTDGLFNISIIVVDNDLNESARDAVNSFKRKQLINIDYYCEPEQNISLARNMAVRNAKGSFIAFIDDDEFPDDRWLMILLKAYYDYGGDGIQGPVYPSYQDGIPKWVIKGKFYNGPNYPSGLVLTWSQGRTGNLFLRKEIFDNPENLFSPQFGRGAEDQDFIRRAIAKGYVFMYCHEAIVYEHIPLLRCKRTFLLKRALLRGKISLLHPISKIRLVMMSCVAIPIYTASLPLLLAFGHHLFMKYLVKDFDHIGRLLAFLGFDVVKEKYVSE